MDNSQITTMKAVKLLTTPSGKSKNEQGIYDTNIAIQTLLHSRCLSMQSKGITTSTIFRVQKKAVGNGNMF